MKKETVTKYLQYLVYIIATLATLFLIYKIINWQKVFESDYQKSVSIKRDIDLPPMLRSSNSTSSVRVISYEEKEWVEKFIKRLSSQKIMIRQMEIGEYFDIFLISENKTTFKISTKMSVEKAWNNTISVLDDEKFRLDTHTGKDGKFDRLEYIDVRFENKIFYKLYGTNENLLASSTRQGL
jgi:hypothetical protein